MKPTFHTNLEETRRKKGLTQVELAEMAGVTRPTVRHTERSQHIPTLFVALRFAEVLDTPVEQLFWFEDDNTQQAQ